MTKRSGAQTTRLDGDLTGKGLEQRQSACSVAGAAVDTQAILISDLSGVEAVRILFAGAAEDTQTMISDLSGVEAVRILFAGAAEDTQTMISDLSGVEAQRHTLCRWRR